MRVWSTRFHTLWTLSFVRLWGCKMLTWLASLLSHRLTEKFLGEGEQQLLTGWTASPPHPCTIILISNCLLSSTPSLANRSLATVLADAARQRLGSWRHRRWTEPHHGPLTASDLCWPPRRLCAGSKSYVTSLWSALSLYLALSLSTSCVSPAHPLPFLPPAGCSPSKAVRPHADWLLCVETMYSFCYFFSVALAVLIFSLSLRCAKVM